MVADEQLWPLFAIMALLQLSVLSSWQACQVLTENMKRKTWLLNLKHRTVQQADRY